MGEKLITITKIHPHEIVKQISLDCSKIDYMWVSFLSSAHEDKFDKSWLLVGELDNLFRNTLWDSTQQDAG